MTNPSAVHMLAHRLMLTWNKNTAKYFSSKDLFIQDQKRTAVWGRQPSQTTCKSWHGKGRRTLFIERRKACQSTCPVRWVPHSSRGVPQIGITTSKKTLATVEVVCLKGKSSVQCTNIHIMTKTNSSWLFTESLSGKESFLFLLGSIIITGYESSPFWSPNSI